MNLRRLRCLFGRHRLFRVARVSAEADHIGCRDCPRRWGMHLALIALALSAPAVAGPPLAGSEDAEIMRGSEGWITNQRAASGMLCCSLSDGRPVFENEYRQRNGQWEVFYGKHHWTDGTDEWLPVPPGALLKEPSPLGMPVAWIMRGRVLCLALSGSG